jgi:cytochrome c-type biogenesis protein CcmH
MNRKIVLLCLLLLGTFLMLLAGIVNAQDRIVTDDDVNAIAKKLYCPVCENIPLDNCGTAACKDWREEIRLQLEDGMTEQQIVDDFVRRFGDRVVGTPQDPLLRAISVATPWIFTIIASLSVIYALVRLRLQKSEKAITQNEMTDKMTDHYQDLLEQDVSG